MNQLPPVAIWPFRFEGLTIISVVLLFILGYLGQFIFPLISFSILIPTVIIGMLIFSEMYARLSYANWSYEFTKDSIKIKKGFVTQKERTIPYARVQNIMIKRSLIARVLGYSVLLVETAGQGSSGLRSALRPEGFFPALEPEVAKQLQDFLLKQANLYRTEGI